MWVSFFGFHKNKLCSNDQIQNQFTSQYSGKNLISALARIFSEAKLFSFPKQEGVNGLLLICKFYFNPEYIIAITIAIHENFLAKSTAFHNSAREHLLCSEIRSCRFQNFLHFSGLPSFSSHCKNMRL